MFSIATLMEDGDPEHELGSSAPDIMASHSNKDASSHPRQVSLETEEYASLSDDFFIEDAEEEADLPSPFKTIVATSKEETVTLVVSPFVDTGDGKTGIVFEASPQHFDRHNHFHKERPLRVTSIHDALVKAGIHERCTLFEQNTELSSTSPEMNFLNDEDFLRVHLSGYMQRLDKLSGCTCHDTLDAQAQQFQSIFLTPDSVRQAKTAAASLCRLVSKVVQGDLDNGFAVIRPPGHHAEPGMAGGYCIVNNVAVAAAYARNRLGVQKVLIVDWDVHHGNGTQSTFLKDPHVLYFSVHRWQGGNFYPFLKYGGPTTVGAGEGAGFNVNVGWSRKGMGDDEYYAVWNRILMPLARDYKPDLVLVSAGFDAADGDMGECHVTPECFGHLTQSLITLASGKVVCSLEGGYVRSVLRECVTHVVGALLNRQDERKEEPVDLDEIDASAAKNIRATIAAHQSYWNCFQQD
jgi:histone deacetylase 6